jgi:TIR domain/YEATS family
MKLAQKARQVDSDRWEWAVWVEGTKEELDDIASVEYTLHPTFSNPMRVVDDRRSKFRLEESGGAEFELRARVDLKTGRSKMLKQWLELERTHGERAPKKEKTVFVSYAAADAALGEAIQQALREHGVEQATLDDVVEAGKPWEASLLSAIEGADLVLALFSDAPSQWVEREARAAAAHDVDVVPIVVGDTQLPEAFSRLNAVSLGGVADVGPLVDSLVSDLHLK